MGRKPNRGSFGSRGRRQPSPAARRRGQRRRQKRARWLPTIKETAGWLEARRAAPTAEATVYCIESPGSPYAPCLTACLHTHCQANRALVASRCSLCGFVIGFDRRFVRTGDKVTHETCAEARP